MDKSLRISFPAQGGRPALEADFCPGAHVFLGVNGSGKSHLLRHIAQQHVQWGIEPAEVAFVEGARTIDIPSSLALNKDTLRFSAFTQTKTFHEQRRRSELKSRLAAAIFRLQRATDLVYQRHSDDVERYAEQVAKGNSTAELPRRRRSPLDKLLSAFGRIFPATAVEIDKESLAVTARKGELAYPVARLSDGEKQCFALLADLFCAGEGLRLVVVDEPELNLHTDLATTLWSEIEDELPDCIFIYATHAVPFASRTSVGSVWYIDDGATRSIPDVLALPYAIRRALLGTLPALSAGRRHLFVEGDENSFDRKLYRWLLNDDVVVHPIGSCTDVVGAVGRVGAWSRIAPGTQVIGVVDRDFRSDERLSGFEQQGVVVLPVHEAESLLCRPDVLVQLAKAIGTADELPDEQQVEAWIREEWEKEKLLVQARRVEDALRMRLAPSIPRTVFTSVDDERAAMDVLRKSAARELEKATSRYRETSLKRHLIQARSAASPSVDEILKFMPGKNLLNSLAPKIGARDERALLNKATRHLQASQVFPDVVGRLNGAFQDTQS